MTAEERLRRYREFETYVDWTEDDARRVALVGGVVDEALPALIDDFYRQIDRHDVTRAVITGGSLQIERLKRSLLTWIRDLLRGHVDQGYLDQRWQVGWRHADIGLDAVFVHLALSRLRTGLSLAFEARNVFAESERSAILRSLNTRLDLDLAIIEDAYQNEHRSRLQASERLATIGQVTGGVAHELRNPLNVVKTSVYYLLNARTPTPEKSAEHLKRIERHVNLADSVIMALSNFARMPVPLVRSFKLGDLVREVLADDPPPSGVNVRINLEDESLSVVADRDQIRIVLGNLIRNACDAMPNGGNIDIDTISNLETGRVDISVRDTGIGISSENLSRIMEPLFSTKARGLGLGLAIARAILDKNRGQLRVESELGNGSTFTLRLPAPVSVEGDAAAGMGANP